MADFNDNVISIKNIDAQTIVASGSFTTKAINVDLRKLMGNITLQVKVTGTGTAKFEWEQSNNFVPETGVGDWVKPVSGFSIATGFTATSGTATNGMDLLPLPMYNSQFFRVVVTETGGVNPIVVNAWLSMQ